MLEARSLSKGRTGTGAERPLGGGGSAGRVGSSGNAPERVLVRDRPATSMGHEPADTPSTEKQGAALQPQERPRHDHPRLDGLAGQARDRHIEAVVGVVGGKRDLVLGAVAGDHGWRFHQRRRPAAVLDHAAREPADLMRAVRAIPGGLKCFETENLAGRDGDEVGAVGGELDGGLVGGSGGQHVSHHAVAGGGAKPILRSVVDGLILADGDSVRLGDDVIPADRDAGIAGDVAFGSDGD